VHFGFGKAVPRELTVAYPDGTVKRLRPQTDTIMDVKR
jgi:hypothetical protein